MVPIHAHACSWTELCACTHGESTDPEFHASLSGRHSADLQGNASEGSRGPGPATGRTLVPTPTHVPEEGVRECPLRDQPWSWRVAGIMFITRKAHK